MRFRKIKKQSKSPKTRVNVFVPYAGFLDRGKAFIPDIFMFGLPVALIIMMMVGYDVT
jgi:hypothetical protein